MIVLGQDTGGSFVGGGAESSLVSIWKALGPFHYGAVAVGENFANQNTGEPTP